ncbi:hypothetical protein SUGI_0706880 [Cryptomeria japonica]|nr:hypothetical protein SUGI_0706880 [Cryptomeria japonica]
MFALRDALLDDAAANLASITRTIEIARKPRGRPLGSKNKPKWLLPLEVADNTPLKIILSSGGVGTQTEEVTRKGRRTSQRDS